MRLRQARKIVAHGMSLTAQQVPWKDSTLDRAVAVWLRRIRRDRKRREGRQ